MEVIAHIGKVPIEEWLPFLVPIVALYLYGRRKERRRRDAVGRLPDASEPLGQDTVARVLAQWSDAKHDGLSQEHLPLLYPPGPDGLSAEELADRSNSDAATVARLLEQLEELEYVELESREGFDGVRAWLTFKGYELVDRTEAALLTALENGAPAARQSDQG